MVFPNTARRRTIADRTDAPMRFRTVCRALSVEVVLLHHALKSFSLRSSNHIDIVARLKLRNAQIDLAFRKIAGQAKLAHEFLRLDASLFEFAQATVWSRAIPSARRTRPARPNSRRSVRSNDAAKRYRQPQSRSRDTIDLWRRKRWSYQFFVQEVRCS